MSKFKDYYYKIKGKLLKKDPIGFSIANSVGNITFNSYWPSAMKFLFTDKITGSSFIAKDVKEAREKVEEMRKKFREFKN
jgi:hypothetical protein